MKKTKQKQPTQKENLIQEVETLITKKYLTLKPKYKPKKKYYFKIIVSNNYIIFATNEYYTNPAFEVYENNIFTQYKDKYIFKEYLLSLEENILNQIKSTLIDNFLEDKKTFLTENINCYINKYKYILSTFNYNNTINLSYIFTPNHKHQKFRLSITNLPIKQPHTKHSLIKKLKTFDILTLFTIYCFFKNYELNEKKRFPYR